MCFMEKMNCIRIRKREDHVSDPLCTSGRVGSGIGARDPPKNHLNLHISLPYQESMHLVDLSIGGVHRMGYEPVSNVLFTYTLMEELALAQSQPQPVIHSGHPQLCLHR